MEKERLSRSVPFRPATLNEEDRTVELVFATEEPTLMLIYDPDEGYRRAWEILSLKPEHVDLTRLKNGASLLDNHNAGSVLMTLGGVIDAVVVGGEGIAKVRFSQRSEAMSVFQDVVDGVTRNVSVGYLVREYMYEGEKDGVPVLRAINWEPIEVTMTPVQADKMAGVRSIDFSNKTEVVMNDDVNVKTTGGTTTEPPVVVQDASHVNATTQPLIPVDDVVGTGDTIAFQEANEMARSLGISPVVVVRLLADGINTRAAMGAKLIAEKEKETPNISSNVTVKGDQSDARRRSMEDGILIRVGKATEEQKRSGNDYRNASLMDIARECANERSYGANAYEVLTRALATSDFPVLLNSLTNVMLAKEYMLQSFTWNQFCGIDSNSDFKPNTYIRTGVWGELKELMENGEYKRMSMPDGEAYSTQIQTKGGIVNITRQMMINDDLGGINRMLSGLARAAALTLELAAYRMLSANSGAGVSLADGNPLFHASRNNTSAANALSIVNVDLDYQIMRKHLAPGAAVGSEEYIDYMPHTLLVGLTQRANARLINGSQYDVDSTNKSSFRANTSMGLFANVVDTPRIPGTKRYIFANPSQDPAIVATFLNGQQNPYLDTGLTFNVDGWGAIVRHDVGFNVVDPKAAVYNAGA